MYPHQNSFLVVLLSIIELVATIGKGVQSECVGIHGAGRRAQTNRNKLPEKPSLLKDTFYEDHSYVVRIRTSYNHSTSITCNAVLVESQLVLSDVTCIKYQGMANIDAKFVQVLSGDAYNETIHDVEQIYINKADPRDPGTELALLRLARPLLLTTECKALQKPDRNYSIESDAKVRVVGFTQNNELKESRTRVFKRTQTSKYICTTPSDLGMTPGCQLLRGAPLLQMNECNQFQLVGILSRMDLISELVTTGPKRHQDCYVMVSSQMKWYDQVKSLSTLAAKNDGKSPPNQPNVIVVSEDETIVSQ